MNIKTRSARGDPLDARNHRHGDPAHHTLLRAGNMAAQVGPIQRGWRRIRRLGLRMARFGQQETVQEYGIDDALEAHRAIDQNDRYR